MKINRGRSEAPGARGVTRRLFLAGGLKATIAAGVAGRMSIRDVLAASRDPKAGAVTERRFDGELIAESYGIAHRLRDGSLEIPALTPEGPLHDAIVLGGGVSGLMAAWVFSEIQSVAIRPSEVVLRRLIGARSIPYGAIVRIDLVDAEREGVASGVTLALRSGEEIKLEGFLGGYLAVFDSLSDAWARSKTRA